MSFPRRPLRLATVAVATGAVVLGTGVVVAGQASAGTSTLFTITKVSPNLVAANTAKQVITVTGTGFDEADIDDIAIAGCDSIASYTVVTETTLVIKTDATCDPGTLKAITITDAAGDTFSSNPSASGGAQALAFVAPPTIATASASVRPVVTANTASRAYADQQTSASITGGTVIKVTAGSTPFVNSTANPLAASLGGIALTKIVMATGGASFTGVLGVRTAAIANPVLKITSGGVTASFAYGAGGGSATAGTHDFAYAGTTISVAPASGPSNGGNAITITGSGFTSSSAVTIGSVSCPRVSNTATSIVCTVPASPSASVAGPQLVTVTTGSTTSVVSAGSVYTYLAQ